MKFTVKQEPCGSALYEKALELRYAVMREPLGLPFTEADLAGDADCRHLMARRGDELVGTLVLEPRDDGSCYLKQIAVAPQAQGLGAGRLLMEDMEALARREGFRCVTMHARLAVEPFYAKLGYKTRGEVFTEVTLPHVEMVKEL